MQKIRFIKPKDVFLLIHERARGKDDALFEQRFPFLRGLDQAILDTYVKWNRLHG